MRQVATSCDKSVSLRPLEDDLRPSHYATGNDENDPDGDPLISCGISFSDLVPN